MRIDVLTVVDSLAPKAQTAHSRPYPATPVSAVFRGGFATWALYSSVFVGSTAGVVVDETALGGNVMHLSRNLGTIIGPRSGGVA